MEGIPEMDFTKLQSDIRISWGEYRIILDGFLNRIEGLQLIPLDTVIVWLYLCFSTDPSDHTIPEMSDAQIVADLGMNRDTFNSHIDTLLNVDLLSKTKENTLQRTRHLY